MGKYSCFLLPFYCTYRLNQNRKHTDFTINMKIHFCLAKYHTDFYAPFKYFTVHPCWLLQLNYVYVLKKPNTLINH